MKEWSHYDLYSYCEYVNALKIVILQIYYVYLECMTIISALKLYSTPVDQWFTTI